MVDLVEINLYPLYHNKLEKLSASLFANNGKLDYIKVDDNNLIYIEPKTFVNAVNGDIWKFSRIPAVIILMKTTYNKTH